MDQELQYKNRKTVEHTVSQWRHTCSVSYWAAGGRYCICSSERQVQVDAAVYPLAGCCCSDVTCFISEKPRHGNCADQNSWV